MKSSIDVYEVLKEKNYDAYRQSINMSEVVCLNLEKLSHKEKALIEKAFVSLALILLEKS